MNPFAFTRLRKKLFIGLLIIFFGIPLLLAGVLVVESAFHVTSVLSAVAFVAFGYLFFVPTYLFGEPLFQWGILPGPKGPLGWMVTILFYLLAAFLLSWPGNLRKNI